jgi:acetyltransferase-like isoleucine patch superfamily enzyme
MGAGSRIGHFTVIKGLEKLDVGAGAGIGRGNWISGYPVGGAAFRHVTERRPELVVEEQAFITHRHRIDCTDAVRVGAFTTVAGYDTQILTHTIDVLNNRQTCAPVTIGRYCFVGTRTVFLSGSQLPDRSVLGAGAVVHGPLQEPGMFYAGVPARSIKSLPASAAYFRRMQGYVE